MFSLGMLVGSGLGAVIISLNVPLFVQFGAMAVLVIGLGLLASFGLPADSGLTIRDDMSTAEIRQIPSKAERRNVWRERREIA